MGVASPRAKRVQQRDRFIECWCASAHDIDRTIDLWEAKEATGEVRRQRNKNNESARKYAGRMIWDGSDQRHGWLRDRCPHGIGVA